MKLLLIALILFTSCTKTVEVEKLVEVPTTVLVTPPPPPTLQYIRIEAVVADDSTKCSSTININE